MKDLVIGILQGLLCFYVAYHLCKLAEIFSNEYVIYYCSILCVFIGLFAILYGLVCYARTK